MTTIAEEQRYQRKIKFFKDRLETCGYRFYNLIQTRRREIPRLAQNDVNETVQAQVESRVLGTADQFINCLRGQHYSTQIPEYLTEQANAFKTLLYTRLAPRYVLQQERFKLLERIFSEFDQ